MYDNVTHHSGLAQAAGRGARTVQLVGEVTEYVGGATYRLHIVRRGDLHRSVQGFLVAIQNLYVIQSFPV